MVQLKSPTCPPFTVKSWEKVELSTVKSGFPDPPPLGPGETVSVPFETVRVNECESVLAES